MNNSVSLEVATLSYDSSGEFKPEKLRIGIGYCSPNSSATVCSDNIMVGSEV